MEIYGNRGSQSRTLEAISSSPRSVLLHGPSHVGKRTFLEAAIRERVEEVDLLVADRSVSGCRDAVRFCEAAPLFSPMRAVVLDGLDLLSEPGQDALLKLCEEPPDCASLLLVAEDEGHVLPALRSRMEHVVRWSPLDASDMESFIDAHSVARDELALQLCHGRPGLYEALLNKPEFGSLREAVDGFLSRSYSPVTDSTPEVLTSMKSGRSPVRDAASVICRRTAEARVGDAPGSLVRAVLEFSSILHKTPSSNAEMHWKAALLSAL